MSNAGTPEDVDNRESSHGRAGDDAAFLRGVLTGSREYIIALHPDGTIRFINRVTDSFGEDEVIGASVYSFLAEDDREPARRCIERVLATGEPGVFRSAGQGGSDRALRRYQTSVGRIMDGDRVVGVTLISTDVEDLLGGQAEELEAQRLEATARLAGGIAHDLNNLLMVMLSHGQFLSQRSDLAEEARADVDEVLAAAGRSAELIRKLLAIGGRQLTIERPVNLGELLVDMERILRRVVPADAELKIVRPESPPVAIADRRQLEQVLTNLIVNAGEALAAGGRVTVEVSHRVLGDEPTRAKLRPGYYASLVVRDDGVGMNGETLSRVFEPFFTTKEGEVGRGLGMSAVLGIVRQNSGDVHIESTLGQGTVVEVLLPLATGGEAP